MAYKNSFDAKKAALGLNPYDQTVNPILWKRSQSIVNQINEMKLVMKIQSDPKSWFTSLRQIRANPLFKLDGEKTFEDVYKEFLTMGPISNEGARDLTCEVMARQDREYAKLCKKYKNVKQKDIDRLFEKLQQQDSKMVKPTLKSVALFDDDDLEYQKEDIPNPEPTIIKPVKTVIMPTPKKTVCINPGLQRKIDIINRYNPVLDCNPFYQPRLPEKYKSDKPITLDPNNALLHDALTGAKRNLPFLLLNDKSNIYEVGPMMYWLVVLVGLDNWYKTGKRPDELFKHCSTAAAVPQVVRGSGLDQVVIEAHAKNNPVVPLDEDTI